MMPSAKIVEYASYRREARPAQATTRAVRVCMRMPSQCGFTLVEMIIVIVITAIIGAVVAVFIRTPVQGYVDSVSRAELADEADTAVRRITRDVRLALPNSIRVTTVGSNQFLELLLTRTGGRYLAAEDGIGGDILSFTDSNDVSFRVVGALPISGSQQIVPGVGNDQLVVYNLGPGLSPADAYNCGGPCNRAAIAAVNTSTRTITLATNPFALQAPVTMSSPSYRFQVVSTPVTYVCSGGTLRRYWGYTIQAGQPAAVGTAPLSTAPNALMADSLTACTFNYGPLANQHSALVGVTLGMQRGNSGVIKLFHQVHVDNTP